jgi:shikimate kinase
MSNSTAPAYILFGIKHSGKTTQGRLLADKTGCPFFDTDDIIKQQTGLSARDIYLQNGPAGFMLAEENACRLLAEKYSGKKIIISTGGGICDNAPALNYLRDMGTFVFLETPEKITADRIIHKMTIQPDGTISDLPAYMAKKNPHTEEDVRAVFHDFYTARAATYKIIADITVQLEDAPKDSNLERIIKTLNI